MTSHKDAAKIAAGLTEAQREILSDCDPDLAISGTGWLRCYGRLCDAGLIRRKSWRIMGKGKLTHSASYEITPLGQAVRAILKQQEQPHD